MKEILLSQGQVALVDDADFEQLNQFNWFIWRPSNSPHLMYAVRKVWLSKGKWQTKRLMHRDLLGAKRGQLVDHKNRNGLDNRRANLRFCTVSENAANSRQHHDAGHSRFKGVTRHKGSGRWQAQTQFQGKRIYLGMFGDEASAAQAYSTAVQKLFGEYARLS